MARYAERTGFDVSSVAWFEAFATWKTRVVLEQLYQRYVRGESTDPRMGERGEPVARLARRAGSMLDRLLPSPDHPRSPVTLHCVARSSTGIVRARLSPRSPATQTVAGRSLAGARSLASRDGPR